MKAAYITETGPPSHIQFGDLPEPELGASQVLIQVGAASVNPIDTYIRGGLIPMPIPSPFIVGCDFAGTVTAVGDAVAQFQVGDRVWGSNQGLLGRQGTTAERIAVDASFVYPAPEAVTDPDLAAVALVAITAHLGLVERARLQSGETLFVNGGAGGVGSAVIQMGKALGCRVLASAGSDERAERCRQLGADYVFNHTKIPVQDAIQEQTEAGVNVFWETGREPDFEASIQSLAENGRMVVMAGREARPPFPVGPFYVKGCSLHGFAMFKASAETQQKAAADINGWLKSGALKPHIGKRFSMSETAAAHQLQEENTLHGKRTLEGKIVLTP